MKIEDEKKRFRLNELLYQCTDEQKGKFLKMYRPQELPLLTIEEVIRYIPSYKLPLAISQAERTIEINNST